jgi:hypothetical protein
MKSGLLLNFPALLAACLLASCIDGREEIHLAADGSGHLELSYSMPAAAAKLQGGAPGVTRLIEKLLAEIPALHSTRHQVALEGDRLSIQLRAAFDSALDLKKATASPFAALPSTASHLVGKIDLQVRGRTVAFSRVISPGRALPGLAMLPKSSFEGNKLVYIIHLPTAPGESNATRTENQGRTLIWDFPLAEALRKPVNPRFSLQIPFPKSAIAGLCALLIFTAALVISLRRKRRKSRNPT